MIRSTSPQDHPRVLLVDLENCPTFLPRLKDGMRDFARIVICYANGGANEPKIPVSVAITLAPGIHEGRVEFVRMKGGGKNAADFGLAFCAGRLVAEMPAETEFVIASGDAGLDHVVDLLVQAGRRATRISKHAQTRPVGDSTDADIHDTATEFYNLVILSRDGVPRRKATLLNSIVAYFKNRSAFSSHEIVEALVARKLVVIDDNQRIGYPEIDGLGTGSGSGEQSRSAETVEEKPYPDEIPF